MHQYSEHFEDVAPLVQVLGILSMFVVSYDSKS